MCFLQRFKFFVEMNFNISPFLSLFKDFFLLALWFKPSKPSVKPSFPNISLIKNNFFHATSLPIALKRFINEVIWTLGMVLRRVSVGGLRGFWRGLYEEKWKTRYLKVRNLKAKFEYTVRFGPKRKDWTHKKTAHIGSWRDFRRL